MAATTNLGDFPGGFLSDKQVLILMTERLNTTAKRIRQHIDSMGKVDETTSTCSRSSATRLTSKYGSSG